MDGKYYNWKVNIMRFYCKVFFSEVGIIKKVLQ